MFWWIIATLLAFFVKGLCGFANTLVFTSILSFGNSNINISPVDLMLTYPPNLIMTWKERRNIQWSMFFPLSAMIVIGSVPGILFLKNADVSSLKVLFGVLVIFFGVEMLVREFQKKKVTDVYSHIIDDDRRRNAEMFEDAFYGKKDLDPQLRKNEEGENIMTVPEGVDPELLAKVLANPEMAALLSSIAKNMK